MNESQETPAAEARPAVPHAEEAPARRALVVGASSGIGAALTRRLARDGYRVAAVARRRDALEALRSECRDAEGYVLPYAHDVLEPEAAAPLFEEICRALGGLDLLIYAAGIMPPCGEEDYDTEQDLLQLAVNTGGCIAWCNAAALLFRTQRSGSIVGISSVAGDRGRKGNPAYATSKAAMTTYLEALRNRLGESGVHVCTIKPGPVRTAMTDRLGDMPFMISAEAAADSILSAVRARANVRYVPLRWGPIMAVIRLVPSFIFRKLNF